MITKQTRQLSFNDIQEKKKIQQMRIEKAKNKNNNGNINLKI